MIGQRDAIKKALEARGEKLVKQYTHWWVYTRTYMAVREEGKLIPATGFWLVNRSNGAMRVSRVPTHAHSLAVHEWGRVALMDEGGHVS